MTKQTHAAPQEEIDTEVADSLSDPATFDKPSWPYPKAILA